MHTFIPTTDAIDHADVIDSRDIISRIEDLESADDENPLSEDDAKELADLQAFASECADYASDWKHGESIIADSYFTDHIKELVNDCYEMPKNMDSGKWPFCHMTIDWEAAADQAKGDYTEVTFQGMSYWIRSC